MCVLGKIYCCKCGSEIKQADKFCGKCGEQQESASSISRPKIFAEFVSDTGKLISARKLPKKIKLDSRNVQGTTIFASPLKEDADGNFKQEKGSRLPIKAGVSWGAQRLKEAVFEKFVTGKVLKGKVYLITNWCIKMEKG